MRQFLSCGYTLLVETFLRMGSDMLTAIEETDKAIGLLAPGEMAPAAVPAPSQNDRALAELSSMMAGIG